MDSQAGYKYLLTYQYSLVICDFTAEFCAQFLSGRELLRQREVNAINHSGSRGLSWRPSEAVNFIFSELQPLHQILIKIQFFVVDGKIGGLGLNNFEMTSE